MSIKLLRATGLRPNLEKDDGYENNHSYILKGQRVYNPNNGLNELYFKNQIKKSEKELKTTYLHFLNEKTSYLEDEEYDGIREYELLDIYSEMPKRFKEFKKFHKNQIEKSQEVLKLIELTKTFKHVKGASNSDLIIFDLQRKNVGEWE